MSDTGGASILVVDDEAALRQSLTRYLDRRGYSAHSAADGRSALSFLAAQSVDLVVTDLYMPGMDGMEFLMALRNLPAPPRVLVMSGGGGVHHDLLETAEALGAAGTLNKPFDLQTLLDAVERVLA